MRGATGTVAGVVVDVIIGWMQCGFHSPIRLLTNRKDAGAGLAERAGGNRAAERLVTRGHVNSHRIRNKVCYPALLPKDQPGQCGPDKSTMVRKHWRSITLGAPRCYFTPAILVIMLQRCGDRARTGAFVAWSSARCVSAVHFTAATRPREAGGASPSDSH